MSNHWKIICLWLAAGTVACGDPAYEEAEEQVAATRQAITLPVLGVGSASPESGTLLPVSPARAANIPPPVGSGFGTPIVNVPGITNRTGAFIPPDTIGDVGLDHYIQIVNDASSAGSIFTIFDKAGAPVSPEVTNVPLSQLVATENECSLGFGDPIVNYDREADRWVLLQFTAVGNHLCVYVSGPEPEALDEWRLYDFDLATLVDLNGNPAPGGFPDYPKLGIWSNAYYVTTNDVGIMQVPAVYALDRDAMLAGTTAAIQRFVVPMLPGELPNIPGSGAFQPVTPIDWDSSLPPPDGAPGLVIRRIDDEVHVPPGNPAQDMIELWALDPDFANPANSTLDGPEALATEDFDVNLCNATTFIQPCADQPGTTTRLSDPGGYVVLWRAHYRNFGDEERIVGHFDVNDGANNPAPHWFELNRAGAGWELVQEDTYIPDAEGNDRWLGSTAMDVDGNIALGYSISSSTIFPSIRYTGRRATDPLGSMTEPEATIVDGERSQIGFSRWGDYSAMNVDPVDDCTFWYTTMYYEDDTTGATWNTRIASFRFPECAAAAPSVCVLGESNVDLRDRVTVTAELAAGNFLELGAPATLNGDGMVGGNALIRSNGVVNGDLTLGGTLSTQGAFTITGTLTENGSPVVPTLQTKTFATGSGFQEVTGNVTLAPGNFGDVAIRPGATVTLNAGTYNFASLNVEVDVNLIVNGMVEVNVQGDFQFGDRSDVLGGDMLLVYSNGGFVRIGTDATFTGILVAPNANVIVSSRTEIDGCVGGENVTFDTDVTLDSGGRSLPTGAPAAPTCDDGIQNGSETGVDCGGPDCDPCPMGVVSAVAALQTDWGAGYCVDLQVTNESTMATTSWSVTIDLQGSAITGSWNGNFSGNSGVITVGPGFDWNESIAAGATNASVGFCANRPPGAGTAVVTSASGSF